MLFNDNVKCPSCGTVNSVKVDLDLEMVGSEERGMGPEVEYEAIFQHNCTNCSNEFEVKVGVWEYPAGVINLIQVNSITIV